MRVPAHHNNIYYANYKYDLCAVTWLALQWRSPSPALEERRTHRPRQQRDTQQRRPRPSVTIGSIQYSAHQLDSLLVSLAVRRNKRCIRTTYVYL